jgi:hypothetical protein
MSGWFSYQTRRIFVDVLAYHKNIASDGAKRKAAARTVETVCAAIAQLLGALTPEECAN